MSPCSAATGMPPHVLRAWAVYWIVYIWARGAEPRVETKEMRVWWADAVVTRAGLHFWVSRSALWKENTFNTDSLTAMQTASVQFPAPEKEQSFSYKLAATRVGLFQTFNRFFHTLAPKFRVFFLNFIEFLQHTAHLGSRSISGARAGTKKDPASAWQHYHTDT